MKKTSLIMLFLVALALTNCHKDKELDAKDPVVLNEEITVSGTQARFEWCVDFSGQFQTGVELSQNENMTDVRRVEATKLENKYVAVVSDLSVGTKYYYRIVVWNKFNNYEEDTKSFITLQTYNVTCSCVPEEGGMVSGCGTYTAGDTCMLIAAANEGYNFVNWTENENQVSAVSEYRFVVTSDRDLVAHFTSQEYTIIATAEPTEGGTVSGTGGYNYGDECTLTATANLGYTFTNWTENGSVVSTDDTYTFTVSANRTMVANFIPTGVINGLFTINENGDQVWFSQGNLQYIGSASTPYWKFADNQWDVLGDNGQGSDSQTVDRDLFGWGTSGYNHGAVCYQPWSTSNTNSDYFAYGQKNYNLYDKTGQADWGYNPISNGGNIPNTWRVLRGKNGEEWKYVLESRTASTVNGIENARYVKAKVANVYGVILFPDNYTHPSSVMQPIGINETGDTGWNVNDYNVSEFLLMQTAGVVFLPAAGCRNETSVYSDDMYGGYWSASYYDDITSFYMVYEMFFKSGNLKSWGLRNRSMGESVRLVCPAQ